MIQSNCIMAQKLNNLLLKVYEKAKRINEEFNVEIEPCKKQQTAEALINYLNKTFEQFKKIQNTLLHIEQQYQKLEVILQKYEQDIRKHIALEQQLKLYGDSIHQQLQESQNTRRSTLQETKKMLAELKRQNQKLHQQNRSLKQQLRIKSKYKNAESKLGNRQSSSKKKNRINLSIEELKKPLKTEYVERGQQQTPKLESKKGASIKVKIEIQGRKQRNSSNNRNKKRKQYINTLSNVKKRKSPTKKIHNHINSNISFNSLYYFQGKSKNQTLDPDQKRKTEKLLRRSARAASTSKQKHYKSQQDQQFFHRKRNKYQI